MTSKEASEILEEVKIMDDSIYQYNEKYLQALNMAIKLLNQEPCEDCISKANALHIGKNEYLRGWHDALCKALSEKYSIHCKEGNFNVIQEETITGLGLSMDCAIGKDVESYISALPSVTPIRKKGHWIPVKEGEKWLYMCLAYKCSNCDCGSDDDSDYCPVCGSEMWEDEE